MTTKAEAGRKGGQAKAAKGYSPDVMTGAARAKFLSRFVTGEDRRAYMLELAKRSVEVRRSRRGVKAAT